MGYEHECAHPLLRVEELGESPLPVRLLGEDWVVWRDGQGRARAARDQCPHRGARLSLGRVCAGELECPYHGWRFEGDGRCATIPAVPGFQPPASHGLAVHALVAHAGLWWLTPRGDAAPPAFGPEAEPQIGRAHV